MTTTPPPTTTTSPASQTSGFQPAKPNYNPPNSVVEGNKTQAESLPTSPGMFLFVKGCANLLILFYHTPHIFLPLKAVILFHTTFLAVEDES